MVQYSPQHLDATFAALADPTRRGVLDLLGHADASVSELAQRFELTLTGMQKHVAVLERAGLVATEKVGRVRRCRLGPRRLDQEAAWIEQHRRLWESRFSALDVLVEALTKEEQANVNE